MRRVATRRDPSPLIQIPVWGATDAPASSTEDASGTDQLLAGLNPEQRRAVTHGEGPLLVVAGAGTGKTQVITRRIAWLIATKRAKPSEILALTFTDQAADEMQVRVDQLVPYGHNDAAIATFQAFGDRLIRVFAFELGLPPDVRVLSRPETVVFLREHLFDFELDEYRPLGDPTRFLDALATLFSRAKDEDVSPAAYVAYAQQLVAEAERAAAALDGPGADASDADRDSADALAEEARRQRELARAFERYQALLAANGCIDFGDQVALALKLVRESPAVREAIQRRFRYILVDEFQDTNRAQAELVALLADDLADQPLLVVLVEDLERLRQPRLAPVAPEHAMREAMEGADPEAVRRHRQQRLDAAAHLRGRLVRERHRHQAVRRDPVLEDQPRCAVRQHARLAAAGAREHEHRAERRGDGRALGVVQVGQKVVAAHGRADSSEPTTGTEASKGGASPLWATLLRELDEGEDEGDDDGPEEEADHAEGGQAAEDAEEDGERREDRAA
jgi:DNA helicase-2/ATP-dependent DNA helicase PcrA